MVYQKTLKYYADFKFVSENKGKSAKKQKKKVQNPKNLKLA